MGCPCKDPDTGELKIVPAKTKEMIYRMQAPHIKELIHTDSESVITDTIITLAHGSHSGRGH